MGDKGTFLKLADEGKRFFRSIYMLRGSNKCKDSDNNMFQSSEVGSVCDNNVSVSTATVKTQDDNCMPVTRDVVVLNANDACEDEVEVLLSKQDCIELLAYLSAATFALRD